jgi:hypothetical protein
MRNNQSKPEMYSEWDELFQSYLSPAALAIRKNILPSTRFNVANPLVKGQDMTFTEMEIRYYGRTIEGPITDKHIQDFAEEINELAAQGWIEYGCLAPLIDLKLALLLVDKQGNIVPGQLGAYFEPKEEYVVGPQRYCLLFYAGSRYSIQELRNRGMNMKLKSPSDEGALPPRVGEK